MGYTSECRSVTKLPIRTLRDGESYGAVAVTQGGAQCGRCVWLRCHELVQQPTRAPLTPYSMTATPGEQRGYLKGQSQVRGSRWR